MAVSQDENTVRGVKGATIQLSMTYPIVSAFEFEYLKEEAVIRDRLDNCSIYLLVQRPLTYFDKVEVDGSVLFFEIADGVSPPLECRIDLVEIGACEPGERATLETWYFTKQAPKERPYRDVPAIKLFRENGDFIVWWSPQKLLFEMVVNGLRVATAKGDPLSFLDFTVLYVGQAFDQKVWDRLTGHTKMQKILTVQNPVGASPAARAPFEVSLVLLTIVGLEEALEIPYAGFLVPPTAEPVIHDFDISDIEGMGRFACEPLVALCDEALTREVEAQLIHSFRPKYNGILFNRYPAIKGGMRSKGYSWTELEFERLPATLRTPHCSLDLEVEYGEPE